MSINPKNTDHAKKLKLNKTTTKDLSLKGARAGKVKGGALTLGMANKGIATAAQAGCAISSAKFKRNIHDMGPASSALMSLRPVSFRYKAKIDPAGAARFGLVAEEVQRVMPDLVVYDENQEIYGVRYDAVNAMLLNEVQKQHALVAEQKKVLAEQRTALSEQRKSLDRQDRALQALAVRVDQMQRVKARG
jgi:uncharacterized coiled-coil protein SlyX